MPGDLRDVLALTAMIQSLVKTLSDMIDSGTYQHDCHPMMVRQNKWRACRYGTKVELINSYTYKMQSLPEIVDFLIDRLSPAAQELGCLDYLLDTRRISLDPTWAERQVAILRETNDPTEVVRRLSDVARAAVAMSN